MSGTAPTTSVDRKIVEDGMNDLSAIDRTKGTLSRNCDDDLKADAIIKNDLRIRPGLKKLVDAMVGSEEPAAIRAAVLALVQQYGTATA